MAKAWCPSLRWNARLLSAIAVAWWLTGCAPPDAENLHFAHGAIDVEVTFYGTVPDGKLFGPKGSLLDHIQPRAEDRASRGQVHTARPGWLHFEYRIDGEVREVLVARRPLMNRVAWADIARAGAALGDDAEFSWYGTQDARVRDRAGHSYRVRLPLCGQSTMAHLSEWNLLIGGVHQGDVDFVGPQYGWIRRPFRDRDLKVGYEGSLSWCQDAWGSQRVARGYFFASRFLAADPDLRTDRLHWRPVLERERPRAAPRPAFFDGDIYAPMRWAPSGRVGYAGVMSNADLFGEDGSLTDRVAINGGTLVDDGRTDWLRFLDGERELLVAARPLKRGLSWDELARAGAVLGDGSLVRVGWRFHRQDATVHDVAGNRYRVRLLSCGRHTLDLASEWNTLIGGIHRGDGDFLGPPEGLYSWLEPSFTDADLGVGDGPQLATWCRDRMRIGWKHYAVNRGYFTVSRFHATETSYTGGAFAWRPVLERVP
jgi:hypothetical protein